MCITTDYFVEHIAPIGLGVGESKHNEILRFPLGGQSSIDSHNRLMYKLLLMFVVNAFDFIYHIATCATPRKWGEVLFVV